MTSDPADDTATINYAAAKAALAGAVDGKYAASMMDVRFLLGSKSFETLSGKAPTNDDSQDALSYLMANSGGVRVSAHIAAPASNIQRAVIAKMGARVAAYAPIWSGIRVIRDEVTNAAEGQIHLTAYMLAAFHVVDTGNFTLRDFKLA